MKKIFSIFLAMSMILSLICIVPVSADSVDSIIQARIDELYNRIGNKYFTTDGTACNNGNSCTASIEDGHSHCTNSEVVQSSYFYNIFGFNLSSAALFPGSPRCSKKANSCAGFASFAGWYIFRNSNSDSVSITESEKMSFEKNNISSAKLGDIISLSGYKTDSNNNIKYVKDKYGNTVPAVAGHDLIFLSADSTGINVLDSNWGNGCKVTKHHINYTYCTLFQIGRVTTRGEITSPDTEAPTISGLNVKDISGNSFTVECNLNDNVGVTRVWFVIYAPGGTYEFGDSASNGYYSKTLYTKDYGGAGTYSVHFYVYDAKENRAEGSTSQIYTILPNQPTNLSSSKSVYKPGEEITFSWEASKYATNYKIEIWNGNTVLYSQNIGNKTSFVTPLSDAGNCAICVSAGNSVGYSEFVTYNFIVTNHIPNKPVIIYSDKIICNTGEEIFFSWDAVNLATDYWVSIYNGSTKVYNASIGNVTAFSSPFAYEGNYAFCVNSGNSNGYSDSSVYNFIISNSVPEKPNKIFSEKSVYQPGEKIAFSWDTVILATDYWVSIYNGENKVFNSSIGNTNSFEIAFSECGTYAFCVNSGNINGYSDSSVYNFIISNSVPEKPNKIFSEKSVYQPGEKITFSWDTVSLATDYWVSIYNGENKVFNSSIGNTNSFEIAFSECGTYAFCVNSGNINGYSESTVLYYTITYDTVIKSNVIKNNNSYQITSMIHNANNNSEIIVAGYSGNKLIAVSPSVNGIATLSGDIDEIKVMAWDSLSGLLSLCDAEVIPESEFITQ